MHEFMRHLRMEKKELSKCVLNATATIIQFQNQSLEPFMRELIPILVHAIVDESQP
jgi:hypothetical protein